MKARLGNTALRIELVAYPPAQSSRGASAEGMARHNREMHCVVDLHCHSSASFDSRLRPGALVRTALAAGLTHVAVTDHDRIDGAMDIRDAAPPALAIIIGQEIRSSQGDVIGLYLSHPVPSGMTLAATSAAIRDQGGLVGLPHPFDANRPSVAVGVESPGRLGELARLIDYVEVHNGRVRHTYANERATAFAQRFGVPGVAASDAHSAAEVGCCATGLGLPFGTATELRAALAGPRRLVVRERPTSDTSFRGRLGRRLRG